jgi:hypothetical protein
MQMSGAHLPPGEAWRSGRMPARRRSTPKAPPMRYTMSNCVSDSDGSRMVQK